MAVRLSALRSGRRLPSGRFLVLNSVRSWVDPRAILWLEGLGQLKKSNDLIGNRTSDLPACSIVPQLRYGVSRKNRCLPISQAMSLVRYPWSKLRLHCKIQYLQGTDERYTVPLLVKTFLTFVELKDSVSFHKSPSTDITLKQLNPVHILLPYLSLLFGLSD
jgi:hypothetical protein